MCSSIRRPTRLTAGTILMVCMTGAEPPKQPKVSPGPDEPDWVSLLDARYGLKMTADLANPVTTTVGDVPGLFRKAGPGPVTYTPVIALGLETLNRGGWYTPAATPGEVRTLELWSYQHKNKAKDFEAQADPAPPLKPGSAVRFDPGPSPFGLWVSNDGLADGGVFTEPRLVAARNARLAKQPYKAMIYPNRDKAAGKVIPHSYLIGWEYSTNDDFQDVVCRVDNVELIVRPAGN